MWKFYVKLGIFCLLFLLTDRLAGEAMSAYSRSLAPDQRLGKLLDKTVRHDLVVLGSSRGAHNLDAAEIGAKTGLSSYNFGVAGSNIDFHAQLLELLLSSGRAPRFVVLAVDGTEVKDDPSINFRFDLLYPLANDERIYEILVERGHLNAQLSQLFHTYREKLGFIEVFRPYALFRKELHETRADGSIPLLGHSWSYNAMIYNDGKNAYSKADESPRLISRFTEFSRLCKKNGIQLVLIISPNFTRSIEGLAARMLELAGEGVKVLDYSSRSEFLRKELFHDIAHLNNEGALVLSKMIGEDLYRMVPQ